MEQYTKDLREYFRSHKKALLVFLVVTVTLCITGMILATFFDLAIMQALNNPSQPFSKFLADFGEFPSYIVNVGFFVAAAVWFVRRKNFWLGLFPLAGAIIFGYIFAGRYFDNTSTPELFTALFNAVFIVGVGVGLFFLPRQAFDKVVFLLLVIFIISAIAHLILYAVKIFWGRMRFRNLADDFSNFTPWYKPNGITGHRSFFSGHVTTACCLTVLWFIPAVFKLKNRFVTGLLFVIPVLYSLAMAYARMVVGAHYLSDTVFSVLHFTFWTTTVLWMLCREPRAKKKPPCNGAENIDEAARAG